jgi:hypothetical protein
VWLAFFPDRADGQTISDVLSFLLTNRSVPSDFARDELAADATRDTVAQFLVSELAAQPLSSSSGGFVYRLNPAIGVNVRLSDSFGPFFTERTLTNGALGISYGITYQQSVFTEMDGRKLRDGTLVANAARLRGEAQPFDVETLTVRLRADTVNVFGSLGLSDRIDVGVALPLVRLQLSGTRIDNYRGTTLLQATASGSTLGLGDLIVQSKYSALGTAASGVAVAADVRLPTGSQKNLLGIGKISGTPRLIGSWEYGRTALHGNVGASFGTDSREIEYRGAVTFAATPRLTVVVEGIGRRLASGGRLVEVASPHPELIDVETIRLSGAEEVTHRLVAVGGFKWNVANSWLLVVHVLRPLADAGLTAPWTPTVGLNYSVGQ